MRETSITNAGLAQLSRLEKLKTLTLDGAEVDDDAGDSIRRMKQLEWLSLEGCAVGDAMLAAIAECPNLRCLSLSRTRVTDEGLAQLSKLKNLNMLYLSSCESISDEGVAALKKLPAPEQRRLHLNIQATGIGEEAARELQAALPHANIVWGVPPVPLR